MDGQISAAANAAVRTYTRAFDEGESPSLVRGRPFHILRIGPLHHPETGELLDTITEEMCAELASVFNHELASGGREVPIDWGHGSAMSETPEGGGSLGRLASVEVRPGLGLYGVPEYNARGRRCVEDNEGVLFTSPEFRIGDVFDKSTGQRIGGAELLAVALTNRPMQDRVERVMLSEAAATAAPDPLPAPPADAPDAQHSPAEPPVAPAAVSTPPAESRNEGVRAMAEANPQVPVPPAGTAPPPTAPPAPQALAEPDGAMSPEQMMAQMKALQEENASLKAKLAEYEAKMAEGTQAASVALTEIRRLTERTDALEKARAAATAEAAQVALDRELDGYEARGLYAAGVPAKEGEPGPRRKFMSELARSNRALFDVEVRRLSEHPEVDLSQRAIVEPTRQAKRSASEEFHSRVRAYAEKHSLVLPRDYITASRAVANGADLN